jgi:hypothetical protein
MNSPENIYWFLLHITQIILFQFYIANKTSSLSCQIIRNRNPKIAQEILKDQKILHSNFWDYIIGTISLGLLFTGYFQDQGPLYWSGKYLSLFGFLFTVMALDLIKYKKLEKLIPLENIRTASLISRKLGNIIPTWSWVLYSIFMIIIICFEETVKAQIINASITIFILVSAYFTEKRSKISGKAIDDDNYRRSEMITIAVIAWSILIIEPIKKNLGHFEIDAIFSVLPIVMFIVLLNSKIYKKIMF